MFEERFCYCSVWLEYVKFRGSCVGVVLSMSQSGQVQFETLWK